MCVAKLKGERMSALHSSGDPKNASVRRRGADPNLRTHQRDPSQVGAATRERRSDRRPETSVVRGAPERADLRLHNYMDGA